MPAQDFYHDDVVKALQADGWIITDDPLRIGYGGQNFYVDLGAERNLLAAEKGSQKIAVEIKSFLSHSPAHDLHEAIGQYNLYRDVLTETDPERKLFLAISEQTYDRLFTEKFGQFVIKMQRLNLLIFDTAQERIVEWLQQ